MDSSALLAIRLNEAERESFHALLLANEPIMSVATVTELTMVWQARFGATTLPELERLLELYEVTTVPVALEDLVILREAIIRFAKGRRAEPAVLNFGDLFPYALARRLGLPLLHKGQDLLRTDVSRMPLNA